MLLPASPLVPLRSSSSTCRACPGMPALGSPWRR